MMGAEKTAEKSVIDLLGSQGRGAFDRLVSEGRQPARGWTVVHLDLANFGLINKVMGRDGGDKILAVVNASLDAEHSFSWFYLGGDAWVGAAERRHFQIVSRQLERIRKELKAVIDLGFGGCVRFDLYWGVSFGRDASSRAYQAESACQEARRSGRRIVRSDDVSQPLSENGFLDRYMLGGIPSDLVQLHRQAIQYRDGSRHYEVLSRYCGDSMGKELFIMERLGMAIEYDLALVRVALDAIPNDSEKHTVNLSNITACDLGAMTQIIEMLRGRSNIAIEITETGDLADIHRVACVVDMLRATGIDVYLDDFGEGSASLSLLALNWSAVKLSRTVCGEDRPRDILAAVIGLAKARGMTVIAECIETQRHLDMLMDMGVDAFQGFLIHRPEPIAVPAGERVLRASRG